jgi:hypothetical protein
MTTWLERYQKGEYEAVWREMIALGDAIRTEPPYSDARAVAHETMRRARHNIELIYQRLRQIGYQFDIEATHKTAPNPLEQLRGMVQGDDQMNSLFSSVLDTMQQGFSIFTQALSANRPPMIQPPRYGYMPPEANIQQKLDAFEQRIGKLPLSVRAWCEIVGTVDFGGVHPGLAGKADSPRIPDLRQMIRQSLATMPIENYTEEEFRQYLESYPNGAPFGTDRMMTMFRMMKQEQTKLDEDGSPDETPKPSVLVSDPLVFHFDIEADEAAEALENEDYAEWALGVLDEHEKTGVYDHKEGDPLPYVITVAPDYYHKANFSGDSYDVRLPDARADLPILGTDADLYFVEYLRKSFAWGGFPGLAGRTDYDKSLIAFLTEGLLAI